MKSYTKKFGRVSIRAKWWDYRWSSSYFVTICTKNRVPYFGEIEKGVMLLSPQGLLVEKLWHGITSHTKNVELGEFVIMPDHLHGIITLLDDGSDLVCKVPTVNNDNEGKDVTMGDEGKGVTMDNKGKDVTMDDEGKDVTMDNKGKDVTMDDEGKDVTMDNEGKDVTMDDEGKDVTMDNEGKDVTMDDEGKDVACNVPSYSRISPKPNSLSTIIRSFKSAVTKNARIMELKFAWHPRFHDSIIRTEKDYESIAMYIRNNPKKWKK
ncbi:MAG: transposase [Cyclobacteriaceae bacterium]|nr:transposase [Cyclobacteriaceae bacterium]